MQGRLLARATSHSFHSEKESNFLIIIHPQLLHHIHKSEPFAVENTAHFYGYHMLLHKIKCLGIPNCLAKLSKQRWQRKRYCWVGRSGVFAPL